MTDPSPKTCYAFIDSRGINLDSIGETAGIVRDKMLRQVMDWRYSHSLYDHAEAWERILETGSVVPVVVSINKKPVASSETTGEEITSPLR